MGTKIIKRYQNRKLYDTDRSVYVTLDDISEMVRRGDDVKVLDNVSGEDLTSMTMTQILLEKEKKRNKILPIETLKGIIQHGGESIHDIYDKIYKSTSGPIKQVKHEANTQISKILNRHDLQADLKNILGEVFSISQKRYDDMQKKIDAAITEAVEKITGFSETQGKIEDLTKKVDELEKKVRELKKTRKNREAPASAPGGRKEGKHDRK